MDFVAADSPVSEMERLHCQAQPRYVNFSALLSVSTYNLPYVFPGPHSTATYSKDGGVGGLGALCCSS